MKPGVQLLSEEPRNKAQVYNARKHSTVANQNKDEIFDLLEMLQNHQASGEGGFLREVIVGSTPSAVLASKQQLQNLFTSVVSLQFLVSMLPSN
jgi:uncharacterized membrane protein YeiH